MPGLGVHSLKPVLDSHLQPVYGALTHHLKNTEDLTVTWAEWSGESIAGLIGGVTTVLGLIGTGIWQFLKWYEQYKVAVTDKSHKYRLEQDEVNHKRETERSAELKVVDNAVIVHLKELNKRLDKQNQQLVTLDTEKQAVINCMVREHQICREWSARASEWMRYAHNRLAVLDPDWSINPPPEEMRHDYDFEFHARSSAQNTEMVKKMPQQQPDTPPPPTKTVP